MTEKAAPERTGSFLGGKRHTISPQEKRSFVEHINKLLRDEPDLKDVLPIDPNTNEIFHAVQDGILLAHLVNKTVPGSVDMNKIEKKKLDIAKGGKFNVLNNHNITLESLKKVGCKVINVSAEDLFHGQDHLVMGLLWQIVQRGLSLHMQEAMTSDLRDETKNMNEKEILLYWMNKHLHEGGYKKTVTNFTTDIQDGVAYAILLDQLCPELSARNALLKNDNLQRAAEVLRYAEKVDAKKFVEAEDIISGNGHLNYAFVANLFQLFASHEGHHENEKEKEANGIDAAQERIRELEAQIKDLQNKLGQAEENFNNRESDLLARIRELEEENRRLKEELDAERKKNSNRDSALASEQELALAEQERELNKLRDDNDKLIRKLRDNEKESKGKDEEMDEMAKRLRELEDREAEQSKSARKKLKEESAADDEIEKLKKKINSLENENNRLEQTLSEMDDELKDMKSREWVRKKAEVEKTDSYLKVRYDTLKDDVVIEGYLVKLANHGNKWKKRYFVLRDNYLFYFQSKESDKKGAKFIRLLKAQISDKGVEGKRQNVVMIQPKKGDRTYKVDFENTKQKEKWLEKLLHAAGTELVEGSNIVDEKKAKRLSWFGRQKEKKSLKDAEAGGRRASEPVNRKEEVSPKGKESPRKSPKASPKDNVASSKDSSKSINLKKDDEKKGESEGSKKGGSIGKGSSNKKAAVDVSKSANDTKTKRSSEGSKAGSGKKDVDNKKKEKEEKPAKKTKKKKDPTTTEEESSSEESEDSSEESSSSSEDTSDSSADSSSATSSSSESEEEVKKPQKKK